MSYDLTTPWQIFLWFIAAASLAGYVLNVKRIRYCFAVWFCTNIVWVIAGTLHGLPSQAFLHLIYSVLSVVGFVSWTKHERKRQEQAANHFELSEILKEVREQARKDGP